jgi:RHS repeat-associated protein
VVYRGGTLVGLVSGTVTSFIDRTTAPSTAYSYTVAAIDAAGNLSSQSSAAGVTTPTGTPPTDTAAPSTPAGLSGTPVAGSRIDLAWTASTDNVGVAGYNVYRDAVKINTVPIGSTAYSDTGLVAGANHTYTVSAIDAAANESPRSGSWSGAAGSGALTTTYTYDPENRLTQLASGSTVLGSYSYDGAGNRYAKTVGGVTTIYRLDLASGLPQVLAEDDGTTVSRYVYGGGPRELDRAGTTYWYLTDTLGSVRLVTDSTGATPATYAYSAFGSTRKSTGTLANEIRFTGERTDGESGLEFLRARTYDPSTGSFLERDSWGISPTNSQSIDAYVYTANNPVNAVDPSGHCAYGGYGGTCTPVQGVGDTSPSPSPKKADSVPQGCSWLPWEGHSCESQAIGGLGNKAGDLAGGIGNWGRDTAGMIDKQMGPLTIAVAVGMCIAGIIETVGAACLPLLGVTAYTGANGAVNWTNGKDPREGWNWQDAVTSAVVATVFPEGWAGVGVGFALGGAQDIMDQEMKNPGKPVDQMHALCAAFGGAGAAVPQWREPLKALKGGIWTVISTFAGTKMCEGQ